jgi:hypothetical protein
VESGAGDAARKQEKVAALVERCPDLSNGPVYALVLAGVLKVMPFGYPDVSGARGFTTYSPEMWIAGFNQLLLLVCACLVFSLARRLFDEPVAWVSAAVFGGRSCFGATACRDCDVVDDVSGAGVGAHSDPIGWGCAGYWRGGHWEERGWGR